MRINQEEEVIEEVVLEEEEAEGVEVIEELVKRQKNNQLKKLHEHID